MPVAVSRTRRGSNEHLSTLGALYCTQLPGGTTQSKIFSCCLYELCSHFLHPTCTRLRIDKKNFDIAVALDSSYEEIRCDACSGEKRLWRRTLGVLLPKFAQCTKKRDPPRKTSIMAFQFIFSGSALKYHRKPKTNENDNVAVPSKRKFIIATSNPSRRKAW
jgi:hypothetical protein